MHLSALPINDDRVAASNSFIGAVYAANGRDTQRLGDNRYMALCAGILDDECTDTAAVVVDQLRRPHVPGDEHGILRQFLAHHVPLPATRKYAQKAIRQIIQVAQPLPPERIVLAQHPGTCRIVDPLDGRFRCQTVAHGIMHALGPAPVACKHAIGFEHIPMGARMRNRLVRQHVINPLAQLAQGDIQASGFPGRIFRQQFGHDDPRFVKHHVT